MLTRMTLSLTESFVLLWLSMTNWSPSLMNFERWEIAWGRSIHLPPRDSMLTSSMRWSRMYMRTRRGCLSVNALWRWSRGAQHTARLRGLVISKCCICAPSLPLATLPCPLTGLRAHHNKKRTWDNLSAHLFCPIYGYNRTIVKLVFKTTLNNNAISTQSQSSCL